MVLIALLLLSLFASPGATTSVFTNIERRAPQSRVNASSKAGLAWANGNWNSYKQYTFTGKVSWYYTWSAFPINSDLEFVPMLWGQAQSGDFGSSINRTISRNKVTAVLGMNEPQLSEQSNLTPEEGAALWRTYLEPLKSQGIRLGSPAPTSAPDGKTWLQSWLAACEGGCNPDFIALHWYGTDAGSFQSYLEDFHNTFNLPIWVTEWACQDFTNGPQCTYDQVVAFLNQTQSFMDRTDWVERYSWFGVMRNLQGVNPDNAMMDMNGRINALGEQYIGAPPGSSAQFGGSKATINLNVVLCFVIVLSLPATLILL